MLLSTFLDYMMVILYSLRSWNWMETGFSHRSSLKALCCFCGKGSVLRLVLPVAAFLGGATVACSTNLTFHGDVAAIFLLRFLC
jgi:hypothetical protein